MIQTDPFPSGERWIRSVNLNFPMVCEDHKYVENRI
jgi:hypothetical protein